MKATDVRKKNPDELKKLMNELSEELREFRFAMSSGQRNDIRRARTLRTDIARIKTVLREQK